MLSGYYLYLWNKEYFLVTDYERKTNKLFERIIKSLNDENIGYLKHNLLNAKCEIKEVVYPEEFGENKAGSKRKYYNS